MHGAAASGGGGGSQRVLSTYTVKCRASPVGITIMIQETIPRRGTVGPLGDSGSVGFGARVSLRV